MPTANITIVTASSPDGWLIFQTIATLLLAIAAFWSIWQNYQLQKRERKERLLNEIIEWAESILLYGAGETYRAGWSQLTDEQKTDRQSAARKGHGFMDIRDKGVKIINTSSYIDADLKSRAYSTMNILQEHIDKWSQLAKEGKINDWYAIAEHKGEVDKSARQLIKKTSDLMCEGL